MPLDNLSVLKELFQDNSPYLSKNGEQVQFYCPFCKHYKKKLSINIITGYWHCWVCGKAGISFKSLLRNINAPIDYYEKLNVDFKSKYKKKTLDKVFLTLPKEFKSLYKNIEIKNPYYKHAILYCKKRGLTEEDIIRYNIGYCDYGDFSGRIIVPSYDADNNLNFYCGRDYFNVSPLKYKLSQSSKNIIGFENFTDFRFPITLVEGVFDAFGVKYNVIPLFGKSLSDKLKEKIIHEVPPKVNVLLDNDAISDSIKICEYLLSNGINCNLVLLNGKDPNEIGHIKTWEAINNSIPMTKRDLILLKLKYKISH